MTPQHTFNLGYFCKKDSQPLNDIEENRQGNCEIRDRWMKCKECEYFGDSASSPERREVRI